MIVPASAISRTVWKESSSGHLAASGAWSEQYALLSSAGYPYAQRFTDCYRINDTAIRCWWTRGRNSGDQAYRSYYWVCVTDKDHVVDNIYRYQTDCTLITTA